MSISVDHIIQQMDHLGLEPVIGLETHVTITTTVHKLFCSCYNQEGAQPNTDICPICTGHLGVLPRPNPAVIQEAIKLGQAMDCEIAEVISFDRKHYYYPDLPKGFQITQYQRPIALGGQVHCVRDDRSIFTVHLDHFHIEEDPAKLTHTTEGTLIDYNRSGKPLVEIVTTPDIHSLDDAIRYMESLHILVKALGISDADMEKGQFKSDISISLRKKGTSDLNPRTEIKNMNSFKFSREAITQEISHQLAYWEQHGTPKQTQTTVKWNETIHQIETMRKKEQVNDYRIMPEPDIPLIDIRIFNNTTMVDPALLPFSVEKRLINDTHLSIQEIQFFSQDMQRAKVLFDIDEKVNDLEFVAKNLMNILKEDQYHTIITETVADMLLAYKYDDYFSHHLLKKYVTQHITDIDFDRKQSRQQDKVTKEDIIQTLTTISTLPAHHTVIQQVQQGDPKALGNIIGILNKTIGKPIPGEIAKIIIQDFFHVNRMNTAGSQTAITGSHNQQDTSFELADYHIDTQYRTHQLKHINDTLLGSPVQLTGRIQSIRDHGDLIFIDLREDGVIFQIKISKDVFGSLGDIDRLSNESVIGCIGTIIQRDPDDINPNISAGHLELDATQINLLSKATILPFEIKKSHTVNESKRMQYRYLDLRNLKIRENIVMRHKVIAEMRSFLNDKDFIEVETPIIGKASDEGSREFIVPSRLHPGEGYTLPQSPQQLKQLTIGAGIDKYYQVARCFRDEDPKGDRQPEFTQLDIELAFASQDQIITLITTMLLSIVHKHYPHLTLQSDNIPHFDYTQVMEQYGCDKPDIRYGLKMSTVTDLLQDTDFDVFKQPILAGGIVKCIRVEQGKELLTKKYLDDKLREFSLQQGLGGLANFHVGSENFITEKLGASVIAKIIDTTQAGAGDTLLFAAGDQEIVNKALDAVRQKIAHDHTLYDPNELAFCRVVNFPMFEKTDEGQWKFTHNPFSIPAIEHLQQHLDQHNIDQILAQQYDIVLNGHEIGGGSIRAHLPDILETTYKIMGYTPDEIQKSVGHMIDAFRYGFPPHGGIALGIDRLMMILQQHKTIREVIAFPKTGDGRDLMMNSPSPISETKAKEANISFRG